jgi:hypothetical protein
LERCFAVYRERCQNPSMSAFRGNPEDIWSR